MPCARKPRINASMTRPFSTATPDRAMNPTPAEMDSGIAQPQCHNSAAKREGNAAKHQQSVSNIAEHGIEQNKNQSEGHRNDNLKALGCKSIARIAPPCCPVSGWYLHVLRDERFGFADKGTEVPGHER